ncbi:MAG: extracellular solute-binding protein [Lachnospiraceae bacterium]|nr:extracellular solute-binding protein [Lachnospiraceae bacterium]
MRKMRRIIAPILMVALMSVFLMTGCSKTAESAYTPIPGLDTKTEITLKIAIPYETNKAMNTVSNAFMDKYPNVTVQMQYIEDYDTNAVQLFKENSLDMILQKDLTFEEETVKNEATGEETSTGATTDNYFYNFAADGDIDFSDTNPDISNNYRHIRKDEDGNDIAYQYSYPLGGETRGVFVNKTLLDEYDLAVPTNFTEFLACCEVLKNNGLIPVQGGGDTAAYGLGMAPAANEAVHSETALAAMAAAEPGVSRAFEDTISKIYTLATMRYFDYKAVEGTGFYTNTSELGQSESFLGISKDKDTFETVMPENNYGYVAFMPYISSTETVIQSLIDEYHLDTELEFICSPLNDEGTKSPVYITPYYGICANKNSENLDWIREFVNFLFQEENNKIYASDAFIIPNTTEALQFVADTYGVDVDKDVTLCGQIRFSDEYNGFTPLAAGLKEAMKCSAQKYMVNLNKDENGNIQYETDETGKEFLYMGNEQEKKIYKEYVGEEDSAMPGYAFCTLEYYLDILEKEFAKYRVG